VSACVVCFVVVSGCGLWCFGHVLCFVSVSVSSLAEGRRLTIFHSAVTVTTCRILHVVTTETKQRKCLNYPEIMLANAAVRASIIIQYPAGRPAVRADEGAKSDERPSFLAGTEYYI
jgi:hypothetical protein